MAPQKKAPSVAPALLSTIDCTGCRRVYNGKLQGHGRSDGAADSSVIIASLPPALFLTPSAVPPSPLSSNCPVLLWQSGLHFGIKSNSTDQPIPEIVLSWPSTTIIFTSNYPQDCSFGGSCCGVYPAAISSTVIHQLQTSPSSSKQ